MLLKRWTSRHFLTPRAHSFTKEHRIYEQSALAKPANPKIVRWQIDSKGRKTARAGTTKHQSHVSVAMEIEMLNTGFPISFDVENATREEQEREHTQELPNVQSTQSTRKRCFEETSAGLLSRKQLLKLFLEASMYIYELSALISTPHYTHSYMLRSMSGAWTNVGRWASSHPGPLI